MSGHGIFAVAGLTNPHITANRLLYTFHRTTLMQIQHPKFLKIRNIQSSHLIQNMSKCIYTLITKFLRIRHCTDSK